MNRIIPFVASIMLLGMTNCSNNNVPFQEQNEKQEVTEPPFKLFPTNNLWTFIKLDTRNGKMWQVQYSIKGDEYRFESQLNPSALVNDSVSGRFELYPTQNIFNFILMDRVDGKTWQVQWSSEYENQAIIPINPVTNI